jgi:hypothetical protein
MLYIAAARGFWVMVEKLDFGRIVGVVSSLGFIALFSVKM